jgi:photosystem II stability/assembly factor-like uncharacterized protein
LPGPRPDWTHLTFSTPMIGFASANDLFAWTADGGRSWQPVSLPAHAGDFAQFSFLSSTDGYLLDSGYGVGPGTLFRTADGGRTWAVVARTPAALMYLLRFVDARTAWVLGSTATAFGRPMVNALFVTRDGGGSWQAEPLPAPPGYATSDVRNLWDAPQPMGDAGWVVGATYSNATAGTTTEFLITTDLGRSWQRTSTEPGDLASVPMVAFDGQHWLAWLPTRSGLYRTTDAGATWTLATTEGLPQTTMVRSLQFVDRSVGWVQIDPIAPGGQLYGTRDGGLTWTALVTAASGIAAPTPDAAKSPAP